MCEECERWANDISQCMSCKRIVCREHTARPVKLTYLVTSLEATFCVTCTHECSVCEKVALANQCRNCSICGEIVCIECQKQCLKCEHMICEHCVERCRACHYYSRCKRCMVRCKEHGYTCEFCCMTCTMCMRRGCIEHFQGSRCESCIKRLRALVKVNLVHILSQRLPGDVASHVCSFLDMDDVVSDMFEVATRHRKRK